MKTNFVGRARIFFVVTVAAVVGFYSCRTARDLPAEKIKPMTSERILKRVQQNAFDYDNLTIRRINCQFSSNQSKTNFRVNLKAIKDEKILVSISKINIPVGRVLLTPDSVTYVNYIDRNYLVDDYSFLSKFLNIDLDFESIQSILSNNIFTLNNRNRDGFKRFSSSVEEGMYVLNANDEQKMYIRPGSFVLTKMMVEEHSANRELELVFDDFVKVDKKDYPGSIEMKMGSPSEEIEMKIKMNGFSTGKIDEISLRIPERYEQVSAN